MQLSQLSPQSLAKEIERKGDKVFLLSDIEKSHETTWESLGIPCSFNSPDKMSGRKVIGMIID